MPHGRRAATLLALSLTTWSAGAAGPDPGWPPWDYSTSTRLRTAPTAERHDGRSVSDDVRTATPTPDAASMAVTESAPGTASLMAVAAIRFYQLALSKPYNTAFNPGGCPYSPTCSEYGLEAFREWGVPRAIVMTADRLMRCHPAAFFGGYELDAIGDDPRLKDLPRWLAQTMPSEASRR